MAPEFVSQSPEPEMKKPSHDAAHDPTDEDDLYSGEPHYKISEDGHTLTISDERIDGRTQLNQESTIEGKPLVDQEGYEERLRQEAEMMVSLESIRVAINKLENDCE